MLRLLNGCKENLITANHLRRTNEGYPPFIGRGNGLDDLYGTIHAVGDNNLISDNLFAYNVPPADIKPAGVQPTQILIAGGDANVVALNHVVSDVPSQHVVLDGSTTNSKVLDSGTADQIKSYSASVAIRATP